MGNGQIVALGANSSGTQDVVVLTPQVVKQTATRLSPVESALYPDGRDRRQQLLHRDRDAVGPGSARRNDRISAQQQWDRARADQNPGEAGSLKATFTTTSKLAETVAVMITARTGSSTQSATLTVVGNGL